MLGIEQSCDYANPSAKAIWKNSSTSTVELPGLLLRGAPMDVEVEVDVPTEKITKSKYMRFPGRPPKNDWAKYGGAKILSALPEQYIDAADLPTEWIWNDVNGVNYATLARNQHIPQYCGSCWAFGTTSALSDRLSIQRGYANVSGENGNIWPEINLAPQVLINEPHGKNSDLNICENCVPGNSSATFTPGVCSAQSEFDLFWVTEYGPVHDAENMKKELFARGPIGCGIDATAELEAYEGGVFSQTKEAPIINHEVSVIGWGVTDDGEEFWVVRNSWGTYWGEEGFFRIKMYEDTVVQCRSCGRS